jgi:cysteine desulfuration protein SufE
VLEKLEELVNELGEADRQERIELLIDLARTLPPLPDRLAEYKDEAHRVPECQSPVFLFAEREGDSFVLHADAPPEAPTVRGFVGLLVEGLSGAPLREVQSVPTDLIVRSGLLEILGMQRVSGLNGVLRRLKAMAIRLAAEPLPP